MHRFLALFGTTLFSVVFMTSFVQQAEAYAGTDPNAIRNMNTMNFRRAIGNDRYKYSSRHIQASDTTSLTGSGSAADRRAATLREARLKLIQDSLKEREFTGERRSSPTYYERQSRSADTAQRRITEAQRQGSIRLRRGTSSLTQTQGLDREAKIERIQEYRAKVKESETNQYQYDNQGCNQLTGRRQAQCWYEEQHSGN